MEDVTTVTQTMLRKWHETNFPGLSNATRIERAWGKWIEESRELQEALLEWDSAPDGPEKTKAYNAVKVEAADTLLTLMSMAEFFGFVLTTEAIAKYNENTNRVFVEDTPDPVTGEPRWRRERDNRPESIRRARNGFQNAEPEGTDSESVRTEFEGSGFRFEGGNT